MSVNRVILVGRLGQNAEIKHTQNENVIISASLATSESYKDKEGKKVVTTSWHRLVAFGKRWEGISQYLSKGTQIYVEGKLQYREFTNKEGVKVHATEIIIEEIKLLGDSKPHSSNPKGPTDLDRAMNKIEPSNSNPFGDIAGDELPF